MLRPEISRLYGNKLIFKCRNCDTEFNVYEYKELYCHTCGIRQNWQAITFTTVSQDMVKKMSKMSCEDQKTMLMVLDSMEPD